MLLFLAPDIAFVAFLAGPRAGAAAYDTLHFEGVPLVLATVGVLADEPIAVQLGLIWLAHIGLDRMLGYGLRYLDDPGASHLERV